MDELARIKCSICGLECNGEQAGEHRKLTGHNKWDLLLNCDMNCKDCDEPDLIGGG